MVTINFISGGMEDSKEFKNMDEAVKYFYPQETVEPSRPGVDEIIGYEYA